MGLFNRGQAASEMNLDGKRAVRAYLGSQLVWDGTMDAFVPVPFIVVSVSLRDPIVSATAMSAAPFITASAEVRASSASGTATVRPETAILVSGAVRAPIVSADSLVEVPAISVSAIVLAPTVSEAFDATVQAPFIEVSAGVYPPQITADYSASAPLIAAFVEVLAPLVTATGTAVVNAPMITVTGTMSGSAVRGSSVVAAPAIAAMASVLAPELRRDAKVTAPLITGTATAYVPNVQGINFQPQGMRKSADSTIQTQTPTLIPGMVADTSQPYTVVSSDRLVAQYSGPMRFAFCVGMTGGSSDTGIVGAYVNDVLTGSTVTGSSPNFNVGATMFGSVDLTVAKLDTLAVKMRCGTANFVSSIVAARTRMNIYQQSQKQSVCSRSTNQTYTTTWSEVQPTSSTADAVLDGNAIVAQFDHPSMILASDLTISAAETTRTRWRVNGVDVGTEASTAAYTGRVHNVATVSIVAGDRITLMISRTSAGSSTLSSGSWGIV